jgi:amidase
VTVADLNIAYHDDNSIYTPTDDVRATVHDAVAAVKEAGATLTEAVPPDIEEAIALGQGVSRVSWGHDLAAADAYIRHVDITVENLRGDIDAGLRAARQLKSDEAQLGIEFYFLMWKLGLYRSRMLSWMQDFDAIVCPAMGYPAQPHGFSQQEDFSNLGYVGYTHPYSLLGWPSLVVRAGTSDAGLPIGVQIIGRPWHEDTVLAIGVAIETALGGWIPPDLDQITALG